MAIVGFSLNKDSEKSKSAHEKVKNVRVPPTATELLTTKHERQAGCIFCKYCHESQDCGKAKKMSLKEHRNIVKDSNSCFNCLRRGHSYKRCRTHVKCAWCGKKHVLLMCPDNAKSEMCSNDGDNKSSPVLEHNLASHVDMPEVYLQTLCVNIVNVGKMCTVKALIERTAVVGKVGYEPIDTREVSHLLFGGVKTHA